MADEEPSVFKQELEDVVQDVKGLVKEAAGNLAKREDLVEEGKSEQTKPPLKANDYQPADPHRRGMSGERPASAF